ncbi:substrate-binding domain-containing protein [Candidatus Neomarinimicrobiota bacterium]
MAIDPQDPTHLYQQIAEQIREQIFSGKLKPDDRIATQNELAAQYGVSLITVKKALAELSSEGIIYSRVGKGTFITATPMRKAQVPHKSIGLVLSDLTTPFFSLIVQSAEKKTSELGYNLLLKSSSDREEKEETQIAHFQNIGVRGVIIASMGHHHQATNGILQLQEKKFPFIMVSYVQNEDISYIGTDHVYGAQLATEHLIDLGYKRIGYINSEETDILGQLRQQGYERALVASGHGVDKDIIFQQPLTNGKNQFQAGYQLGLQFAKVDNRPDAIFAFNDLTALGFEQSVLSQGLRIPEDVAIVGFDNIERDLYAPVPLTTVRPPTSTIGALAVETLVRMINGDQSVTRTFLKPQLVIRESCGANKATNNAG